jgi:propanediol dehydratase small subunit
MLSQKFRLLLILLTMGSFFYKPAYSQQASSDPIINSGNYTIVQDLRLDSLLNRHIRINKAKGTIEGYRVQIHIASGTNSKKMANDTKAAFLSKYPDIEAYVIYQQPNFKVRAGDFRTRLEAHKLLHNLKRDYPGAFIVKDDINFPKL